MKADFVVQNDIKGLIDRPSGAHNASEFKAIQYCQEDWEYDGGDPDRNKG